MTDSPSDFSDKAVLEAWSANAEPWIDAVRGRMIASRNLVTDAAIVEAIAHQRPRSLIDIGCGEGWLVREQSARGVECVGVDAVPALIEAGRAAGGDFRCLSYAELAAGALSETFDVAVCNFSLIGDIATECVVTAAPALLNLGGVLIIQTLHPVVSCGDAPYVDGWRAGSWAGIDGDFAAAAPWYFRTLQSWFDLIARGGLFVQRMMEPLHPDSGKPASVIFVCAAKGAAA